MTILSATVTSWKPFPPSPCCSPSRSACGPGLPRDRLLRQLSFWPLLAISLYIQFLGAVYFPCGWNASPVDVDRAPERLWDFYDTELSRCQAHFVADVVGFGRQHLPQASSILERESDR